MPKPVTSSHTQAAMLLLMLSALPIIIWIRIAPVLPYLAENFRELIELISPWSELGRGGFWLFLAAWPVFSLVAAALLAFVRNRNVIRAIFAGGVAVVVAACAVGLWPFAVISMLPLPWIYKAEHEI